MKGKIKRVIIVYLVMIPAMWFLTGAVWGGVFGTLIGIEIRSTLKDPKKIAEVKNFIKEHGISDAASKAEIKARFENLSPEDKAKFEQLMLQDKDIIITFGSALTGCVILFGLIGIISGALTKTWLFVGILPGISFLLDNPIIRFESISNSQKIILVLVGQFLVAYVFAFLGAYICNAMNKRKQQKLSLNNSVHTDAE